MAKDEQFSFRQLPVGAELTDDASETHFRVWTPQRKSVNVRFENSHQPVALVCEGNGYFSGFAAGIQAGATYKYELDGGEAYPDPAARFQPSGPHGYSEVIDPNAFAWTDENWRGISLEGQVIYELHLGTFTQGGTWETATAKLSYLRDTGVTAIEVMPVADFPGRFGWGYDGVQPFAPASIYGRPEQMRSFVNDAHALGLAVILDVVYNHIGPDGNYFPHYSPFYFSREHKTDWGAAINFDGENSGPVREFFIANAEYWIREFHLDGLRIDATQDINDDSQPHILGEIGKAARRAAQQRGIILLGENEPQQTELLKPVKKGGAGLDALWNDDYHHSAMVALTGKAEAYYTDYRGAPQEFVSAMKYGYLYQGQWYKWQKKRRGAPTFGLPHRSIVTFIQNHDQIANSARGLRVHEISSPGVFRALTALTLLGPGTPMLFQGQEFAASTPFLFFADHKRDLAEKIRNGRVDFLHQWRSLQAPEMMACFSDPGNPETFIKCRLDFSEVEKHGETYALHRDLLRIRREDPVISRQGEDGLDGAVLSSSAFLIRFFSPENARDRLLLVNLGEDLHLNPAPEPLLAPPPSCIWNVLWSTEDPQYGGCGTAKLEDEDNWHVPGRAAVLLHPAPVRLTQSE
jgi:maltooligosyltrehalose trehalohydrolase